MPDALVFIPFDYLGGSADSAWTGRAASTIAAAQTASLTAPAVRDAVSNRARHIVAGYVTVQSGALLAVATVRDEAGQRTIRSLEARGKDVLEVASSLAAQLVPKPVPYTTSNVNAVRELFAGNPDSAAALDPKYGSAQLVRIESLLRAGDRDAARSAIALARSANLSTLERAQLQAIAAETPKERSDALLLAASSAKYDLALWRGAGDAAMTAKDHAGAAQAYRKAAVLDPDNIVIWNTLAYALALSGDLEGAKASIAEYQKLQPRDANSYDSLGEIYFSEGRFREAEQQFVRAFDMDNTRLGGGEAYRAGLAAFLAGDRAKADAHFGRYLAIRTKLKDEFTELRRSIWLYSTGREEEARQIASKNPSPAAKSQLALWDAVEGKGVAAFGDRPEFAGWKLLASKQYPQAVEYWRRIYDNSPIIAGNDSRVLLALALHGEGRRAEAQSVLAKWPLPPLGPDTGFSSVVFAKAVALKAGRA